MTDGDVTTEELRLAPEAIEAVAQRVAELVGAAAGGGGERRERITAEEVSRWWGVGRRWVYDHADELGARRLGSGRRPRLRFDPDEVAERLGPPNRPRRGSPDTQGLRATAGDCGTGSLSTPSRATVGGRHKRRPGRELFGGFVLRLAGLLLVLAGGVGVAIGGDASGILVATIGGLLWLAGHWHYALRRQEYKSPLARQIFCRWTPAWLDPTRDWSVPVSPDRDDRGGHRNKGRRSG